MQAAPVTLIALPFGRRDAVAATVRELKLGVAAAAVIVPPLI